MSSLVTSNSSDLCPWIGLEKIRIVVLGPPAGWLEMTSGNTIQSYIRTEDNAKVPPIFNNLRYSRGVWWMEVGRWSGLRRMSIIALYTWDAWLWMTPGDADKNFTKTNNSALVLWIPRILNRLEVWGMKNEASIIAMVATDSQTPLQPDQKEERQA